MASGGGGGRRPANGAILILRIPEVLRERCARQAYVRGMSLSEAVREAIEAWMGDDGVANDATGAEAGAGAAADAHGGRSASLVRDRDKAP